MKIDVKAIGCTFRGTDVRVIKQNKLVCIIIVLIKQFINISVGKICLQTELNEQLIPLLSHGWLYIFEAHLLKT